MAVKPVLGNWATDIIEEERGFRVGIRRFASFDTKPEPSYSVLEMLISDTFVVLHPPKTGGSFVTEAIQELYVGSEGRSLTSHEKHGAVADIPFEDRSKQLVVTVRNPFEYYASVYQFGYWIGREEEPTAAPWDCAEMRRQFASYPYLTFEEFIKGTFELGRESGSPAVQQIKQQLKLGPLTMLILKFSVPDYVEVLERLTVDKDTRPLKALIARVRFLHAESLNRDTFHWLLDLGISRAVAENVIHKSKVQPRNSPNGNILRNGHGQPRDRHWSTYFNSFTRAIVVRHEWLFFELLPEYAWAIAPAELCSLKSLAKVAT